MEKITNRITDKIVDQITEERVHIVRIKKEL